VTVEVAACANTGSHAAPRLGAEVQGDFIKANIDRQNHLPNEPSIVMSVRQKPEHLYAIKKRVGPWGTVYRVSLTRAGETVAKLFRDRDHGGSRAALKAAKAWRDAHLAVLAPKTRAEFGRLITVKNTSGCPGVYRRKTLVRGREYWVWQAQSPTGAGPLRTRSFSVNRYGEDQAYALAVQVREGFLQEAQGHLPLKMVPVQFRRGDD